jgi:hypothetical protein
MARLGNSRNDSRYPALEKELKKLNHKIFIREYAKNNGISIKVAKIMFEEEKETEERVDLPKVGDYIHTPRFLNCKIASIFNCEREANEVGYTGSTHYDWDTNDFKILGVKNVLYKKVGVNKMTFACIKE